MFVNKLDVNVEDRISHFVDAMNVGSVVDSREDCKAAAGYGSG